MVNSIKKYTKEKIFEIAKQYKYKFDFRKNDNSAYAAAHKNGWIKEMNWFEKPKSTCEKNVLQYSLNGEFVKEWTSAKDIEKQLGYKITCIYQCCRNIKKTAYGFIWKYKKMEDTN